MVAMAPEDETPDVMSSLPKTRPQRRSARRDSARKPTAAKGSATASRPAARKKKAAAAKATPVKKRATTARAKAAAKPKTAAKPRSASRPKTAARPRATAPRIPPAGFAPPRETEDRPAPSGVELVGTAIQAAGELAQIGAAIGGQALKSALGRLGRS